MDLPPANHEADRHGCHTTLHYTSATPIHTGKLERPGTLTAVAELKVTACFSERFHLMRNNTYCILERGLFSLIFATNIKIQK